MAASRSTRWVSGRARHRRPRADMTNAPGLSRQRISRAMNSLAVQGHDHPLLVSRALATGPCNWLVQPGPGEFDSQIKVRYRQRDQQCRAHVDVSGVLRVRFAEPQRAVTPGQFAVLYHGERCLGGGIIEQTTPQA